MYRFIANTFFLRGSSKSFAWYTPPKTNMEPEKWWSFNRNLLFQGSFSGSMLVFAWYSCFCEKETAFLGIVGAVSLGLGSSNTPTNIAKTLWKDHADMSHRHSPMHPGKLTWNQQNHPIENENHLPNLHFWVQHVDFSGCTGCIGAWEQDSILLQDWVSRLPLYLWWIQE